MHRLRTVYLYTLVDPRTGTVRYVGKTSDPDSRRRTHQRCQPGGNPGLSVWFAELQTAKKVPVFEVIAQISSWDWALSHDLATAGEFKTIRFYRQYNRFRRLERVLNLLPKR